MKYIILVWFLILCGNIAAQWTPDKDSYRPTSVREVLDIQQKKAFNHFWKFGNKENGMIHASSNANNKTFTIGGSGFGVMVIIAGVERGWIKRNEGAERIVNLVRYLKSAKRFHGVWPHWVDADGKPVKFGKQIESGDLVETSFMMMGLLCAKNYFDRNNAIEEEIRKAVDMFWNTVEWNFYTNNSDQLYWLWENTNNTFNLPIKGYNEALITYILALAAPQKNAISPEIYVNGWLQNGKTVKPNRKFYGYPLPFGAEYGGPMFLSHYTFLGLNPKQMEDKYLNYYHNSINHAMVNRHYCITDAPKEYGYDEYHWGLTACNGPKGKGYAARTPKRDDGVIAPTAAISSMPYVPFYAIQVLLNLHHNYPQMQSDGGFGDAYSNIDKWYFKPRIAIDQAPIVIMIENYRSGLFWKLLGDNPDIRRGLELAGINKPEYKSGFQHAITDTRTGLYDMVMHPDREHYEIDFYIDKDAEVSFKIIDKESQREVFKTKNTSYVKGEHIFSFTDKKPKGGKAYTIEMYNNNEKVTSVDVKLN